MNLATWFNNLKWIKNIRSRFFSIPIPSLNYIDITDRTLAAIINDPNGMIFPALSAVVFPNQTSYQGRTEDLAKALKELGERGFAADLVASGRYVSTIKGHLFFATPFLIYKTCPFRYERFTKRLLVCWNLVKIFAGAANAIVIIYISWIAYKKPNDTPVPSQVLQLSPAQLSHLDSVANRVINAPHRIVTYPQDTSSLPHSKHRKHHKGSKGL